MWHRWNASLLSVANEKESCFELKKVSVDPYSEHLLSPKMLFFNIKVYDISSVQANILKQEMLSIGGEAAVSREALVCSKKKGDVVLSGTLKHFKRLSEKLAAQPFRLNELGEALTRKISSFTDEPGWVVNGNNLLVSGKPVVMGILNVTPDSFSDGGKFENIDDALRHADKMISDGADIIDIGGESSRPGAKAVSVKAELKRVLPVLKEIKKRFDTAVSVDTCKSAVAEAALDEGAGIINDISGLAFDGDIARVVAKKRGSLIIMHMKGSPSNMQRNPVYKDLTKEIIFFFEKQLDFAVKNGVQLAKIALDPGIGFGKTVSHNLEILKNIAAFRGFGRPVMIGASRKSFIGNITGADVDKRAAGSVASAVAAYIKGARIFRVHDVFETKQAINIAYRVENG